MVTQRQPNQRAQRSPFGEQIAQGGRTQPVPVQRWVNLTLDADAPQPPERQPYTPARAALEYRDAELRRRTGGYRAVRVSIAGRPLDSRPVWVNVVIALAILVGLAGCGLFAALLAGSLPETFSISLPQISLPGMQIGVSGATSGATSAAPSAEADAVSMGSIAYFGYRSGVLTSADERHRYSFEAQAGHFVLVEVTGADAGFDPTFSLIAPDGSRLAGATDPQYARLSLTLPVSGTYAIDVGTTNGTGGYQLNLRH